MTGIVLAGVAALAVGVTAQPGVAETVAANDDAPLVQEDDQSEAPGAAAGAPMARAGRKPGANPRGAFFGDSVAWTAGSCLPPHPGLSVTNRAIEGCGIAWLPDIRYIGSPRTNYDGCEAWDQKWQDTLEGDDPDVAVILLNTWTVNGIKIRSDGLHFTPEGVEQIVAPWLLPQLKTLATTA